MELRRDVFQAVADPTRREIIQLVAPAPMASGMIAAYFPTARQTVSRHLRILVECELLSQRKKGREMIYGLNPEKVREIYEFLKPLRKFWDERANTLEVLMQYYDTEEPFEANS